MKCFQCLFLFRFDSFLFIILFSGTRKSYVSITKAKWEKFRIFTRHTHTQKYRKTNSIAGVKQKKKMCIFSYWIFFTFLIVNVFVSDEILKASFNISYIISTFCFFMGHTKMCWEKLLLRILIILHLIQRVKNGRQSIFDEDKKERWVALPLLLRLVIYFNDVVTRAGNSVFSLSALLSRQKGTTGIIDS